MQTVIWSNNVILYLWMKNASYYKIRSLNYREQFVSSFLNTGKFKFAFEIMSHHFPRSCMYHALNMTFGFILHKVHGEKVKSIKQHLASKVQPKLQNKNLWKTSCFIFYTVNKKSNLVTRRQTSSNKREINHSTVQTHTHTHRHSFLRFMF